MRCLFLISMLCCGLASFSQYKNDNVLFKTVYMEDLCTQIKNTPGAVLLDVRSKGEYEDTSTAYNLNIGRLKNTIHLDINEMPARWRELTPYKDKPVFVMCSHSQRSRRVSKMLADSGFTNIINVNGGLTTFNLLPTAVCKEQVYETGNKFKFVSPLDLCNFLSANKDLFILEVRKDSVYQGIYFDERYNMPGKLVGSVNIPLASLDASITQVPKGKKILVVDEFGNNALQAARKLTEKGYTDVHMLFNGMDMLASRSRDEFKCLNKALVRELPYQLLASDEFDAFIRSQTDVSIIDVRPAEEFNNQSKTAFRNVGHIRDAVNIPASDLLSRMKELGDKNKTFVLYHFSSHTDAYASARSLAEQGFKNVFVLTGGIFNLRWQAANYKGRGQLKEHVVDVPAENL